MQCEFMSTGDGLLNACVKPHCPHCIPDFHIGEGLIRADIWVHIL